MSQEEVLAIMKAKAESENEAKKRSWEQARIISYFSFIAFRGCEHIKSPEDLFKISDEEVKKAKTKTGLKDIKKLKKIING